MNDIWGGHKFIHRGRCVLIPDQIINLAMVYTTLGIYHTHGVKLGQKSVKSGSHTCGQISKHICRWYKPRDILKQGEQHRPKIRTRYMYTMVYISFVLLSRSKSMWI